LSTTKALHTGLRHAGTNRRLSELLLKHAVWLILLFLLAIFCAFIPGYAQSGIFFNILEQSTFVGILSVALAIVIIAGQMDLSIESTMALAAMLTAWLSSPAGLGWQPDPAWRALQRAGGLAVRDHGVHRHAGDVYFPAGRRGRI
jgi:ribose/xylose/arabinose/galactoside ABC-type transport system permease subunit